MKELRMFSWDEITNDCFVVTSSLEGNKIYMIRLVDKLIDGLIVQNYGYHLTSCGGGGSTDEKDILKWG